MKRLVLLIALVVSFAFAAPACISLPPTGQLVVYIDTDAPVPPGAGRTVSVSDPAPLFDTLRVEVFAPGESTPCSGCVREFPVDADKFAKTGVSVGVPAKVGVSGYRLRATLFLQEWVVPCFNVPEALRQAMPACATDLTARDVHPATALSRTVSLPAVADDHIDEVSVVLETESVGVAQGSPSEPVAATAGKPSSSQVGTWPGAKRRGCATEPRKGEVCVPAGAFWSGNARVAPLVKAAFSPHLVVVSPFFLKSTEVTISECRAVPACDAFAASIFNRPKVVYCQYTKTPTTQEKIPLNCIEPRGGDAFCEAWGGQLATSAQLEYAGRGLVGTEFVWGNDDPTCEDAIWGRSNDISSFAKGPCFNGIQGPVVPGAGKRDRLVLETGTIVDLGGNLQEWTRDVMGPACECNVPEGVLHDPICNDPSGASRGIVGGAWAYGALSMAPGPGGCGPDGFIGTVIGFRCSRAGE